MNARFQITALTALVAACATEDAEEKFFSVATERAMFPACEVQSATLDHSGEAAVWKDGEAFSVRLDSDCAQKWLGILKSSEDFWCIENICFNHEGPPEAGLRDAVVVHFGRNDLIKFAWRDFK